MLTDQTVLVATSRQVSCDLAGEATILNLKDGQYYGLKGVGAHIWEFVSQPRTVNEIHQKLLQAFEVEPERCHHDLMQVLSHMLKAGLVEVQATSSATPVTA